MLAKNDDLDRCGACRVLGELGDATATIDLVRHLKDEDIDVCVSAAEALAELGDPVAVEPLVDTLGGDPSGEVRIAAVEALGRIGGKQAIAALIDVAVHAPEGIDEAEDDWDPWWDMQRKAVQGLGRLGAVDAVPALSQVLADEEGQDLEADTLSALARIDGPGEAVLIHRLSADKPRTRRRAARALQEASSNASVRALATALEDTDDDVREAALTALAGRGATRYLRPILALLKDDSPEVRQAAVRAVEVLSRTAGVVLDLEEIIPAANDRSPVVRAAAIGVIDALLDDERVDAVQGQIPVWVGDPEPAVAIAACRLAGRIATPEIGQELLAVLEDGTIDARVRAEAARALGRQNLCDAEMVEGLSQAILDADQPVQMATLSALASLAADVENDAAAPLDVLFCALRGELPEKAETAADVEAPIEAPEQSEVAQAEVAQAEVAQQLPMLQATGGVTSTLDAVALENAEAAMQAHTESGKLEDTITLPEEERAQLKTYFDMMERQKERRTRLFEPKEFELAQNVQRMTARVLGGVARDEVMTALKDALQTDVPEFRREVVNAIARIAREAPDTAGVDAIAGELIPQVDADEPQLRLAAVSALGAIGSPSALPVLVSRLGDEDVVMRARAAHAVGDILQSATREGQALSAMPEEAFTALVAHLTDDDPAVAKVVAETIGALGDAFETEELRDEMIARLIGSGLVREGETARPAGRALRALDSERAATSLIERLGSEPTSQNRRFVLEMVEEVFLDRTAA